jgi:PAS domain S-box-containing protein
MSETLDSNRIVSNCEEESSLYKNLIDNSIDAVILVQDRQLLLVNKAFCKLFGYTKKEIIKSDLSALLDSQDRDRVLALHHKRMNGEKDTDYYTARFIHKSGRNILIELNASTVQVNGKNASFASIRDITRREQMEKRLRESEAKYKALVENSQDGILIVHEDCVIFANSTFCRMLEYKRHDVYRMHAVNVIHPDDLAKIQQIEEHRRNADFSTLQHRIRMITQSRKECVCEVFASCVDFQGIKASFLTIHDISERIRVQQALQRSELKYHGLAEMLPMAVYELDKNGMSVYMNQTGLRLLGEKKHDPQGRSAASFFSESDRKLIASRLSDESRLVTRRNGKLEVIPPTPSEYTICRPDGTKVPILLYGSAIVENDEIVGTRGIMIDISERKAMENALRESERKYRELADFMPQTLFELDEQLHLVYVNRCGKETFGFSDADYGKFTLDCFVESDRPLVAHNLRRLMEGETRELMFEYTGINVQGLHVPVITYSIPIYKDEKFIGVRGIAIDISERKANERALRDSEKKYRELTEMLPQMVYEMDKQGNVKYLNKAGRDRFGSDYQNKSVSVFSYVVNSDHVKQIRHNMGSLSNNTAIAEKRLYFTFRQKDGKVFDAMISAAPLIVNGEVIGSRGIMIDMTEQRAMQKALAESEEKYRLLIENATDGIVIVQDGLLKFANQTMCGMLAYTLEDLINKPLGDYIDKEDPELFFKCHERNAKGELSKNIFRTYFVRKDTKRITVELNARTLNFEGRPAEFIVIRDITERLKIETELQFAKFELEKLNSHLEKRVKDSSKRLAEARTQLINLQKENLQSQYDVLKQQVNPHFLFNSLNVLTSLIKIEPDLAERFSEQLSKVYRYVLENRDNELIDLHTELTFLNAYIFLINIRFMDKLIVRMDISEDKQFDKIIPLAMQLLIENAIKHNVMSKSRPLVIDIFVDENNYLNVINCLQERPSQVVSTGLGLRNIINRYQLLNLKLPVFEKTENQFIARIPLVKNYK